METHFLISILDEKMVSFHYLTLHLLPFKNFYCYVLLKF